MSGPGRLRSRLKTFIVDTFADVDRASILAVVVAKVLHSVWRGFGEA